MEKSNGKFTHRRAKTTFYSSMHSVGALLRLRVFFHICKPVESKVEGGGFRVLIENLFLLLECDDFYHALMNMDIRPLPNHLSSTDH